MVAVCLVCTEKKQENGCDAAEELKISPAPRDSSCRQQEWPEDFIPGLFPSPSIVFSLLSSVEGWVWRRAEDKEPTN